MSHRQCILRVACHVFKSFAIIRLQPSEVLKGNRGPGCTQLYRPGAVLGTTATRSVRSVTFRYRTGTPSHPRRRSSASTPARTRWPSEPAHAPRGVPCPGTTTLASGLQCTSLGCVWVAYHCSSCVRPHRGWLTGFCPPPPLPGSARNGRKWPPRAVNFLEFLGKIHKF